MTRTRPSAQGAHLDLSMPIKAVPNSNDRSGWRRLAVKRADMRKAVGILASDQPTIDTPAGLTVMFTWPDKRRRDLDNFELKGLIDGLVDGGMIPDDDGRHLPMVTRVLDVDGRTPKGIVALRVSLMTLEAAWEGVE